MKCPKCGFNSFEYYDSCKKCSADLTGYKLTYSISSLVLPKEVKAMLAAELRSDKNSTDEEMSAAPEEPDDIFSFDLPDDSALPSSQPAENPFDFNEPEPAADQASSRAVADDIFSDLLESTPQTDVPLFTAQVSAVTKPAAPSSSGTGEFDFDSFSWDDTPDAPAPSEEDDPVDDFDSFFDGAKENSST
jgi:hypothetical protein